MNFSIYYKCIWNVLFLIFPKTNFGMRMMGFWHIEFLQPMLILVQDLRLQVSAVRLSLLVFQTGFTMFVFSLTKVHLVYIYIYLFIRITQFMTKIYIEKRNDKHPTYSRRVRLLALLVSHLTLQYDF